MAKEMNHDMQKKYSETWFGIWGAVLPVLAFFGTILVMSIFGIRGAKPFWVAGIFSTFAAFLVYKDKKEFQEAVIDGIKNDIFPIIMLSFFFAGILSKILTAGNLVNGLLWVTSQIHLPTTLLPLLIFLSCVVISVSSGSASATITAVASVMLPLAVQSGCDPAVTCGAILGGSIFGDNLAPISDTTIASALTQETTIKKVVRSRIKYAVIAAAFASIFITIASFRTTVAETAAALTVDAENIKYLVFLIIPVLVVFLSLRGANLLTALLIGDSLGVIMLLLLKRVAVVELFHADGIFISGIEGMIGALILIMFGFILASIMQDIGLLNKVLEHIRGFAKTPRSAEIIGLIFIAIVSIVIGAPTVNIAICGPIIHEIMEPFRIDRARAANVLDGLSCGVGALMPHNPPSMMLAGIAISTGAVLDPNFGPLNYIKYNYHCMALVVVFTIAILTGWGRKTQTDSE